MAGVVAEKLGAALCVASSYRAGKEYFAWPFFSSWDFIECSLLLSVGYVRLVLNKTTPCPFITFVL